MPRSLRSRTKKAIALIVSALALAALSGCTPASAEGPDGAEIVVRIPDPGNIGSLALGKKDGSLDAALAKVNAKVSWTGAAGAFAPAALALNAGELDIASGSITSAIMALGQNPSFVLVAAAAPDDNGEGILVRDDSGIETIEDLVGKKVAVWHGSTSEYLLLKALAEANIPVDQVERVYLPPAESAAVFHSGKVDAWATWSTFSIAERANQPVHFLVNGKQVGSQNYSVLAARKDFAEKHPEVVTALYEFIQDKDEQRAKNPEAFVNVFRTTGPDAVTDGARELTIQEYRDSHSLQAIGEQQLRDFDEVAQFYADRGVTKGVIEIAPWVIDLAKEKKQ